LNLRWLAGLLIFLLSAIADTPPASARAPATADLERTLSLLEQVDPQTLPEDQRVTLYLALADAFLADGQPDRALVMLARAHSDAPGSAGADAEPQVLARLKKLDTSLLAAALQAGTPLATLIHAEMARRGAAPPVPAIGVVLPLSGRYAPFGEAVRQGLELARTAMPSAASVRFVYRDSAGDGAIAARLVEELAAQPQVLGVIGPLTSGEAQTAASQADRLQLPMLLLAPQQGATGDQVFRCALTDTVQVQALADYADRQGHRRHAVFYPANRGGERFAELFQMAVERQGGQVVARRSYPPAVVDLRQELEALAAEIRRSGSSGAETLFLPDDARQIGQIVPQLGFSRLDQLQLIGIGAWSDPELVRLAGPQIEGAVFVDGFFADSPWPQVSDFVTRFTMAYGSAPGILAAQGYDVGRLALSLLTRGDGLQRLAFRQGLGALRDFQGVTGLIRFNEQGDAEQTPFLLQVQDGSVVQIN